MITLTKSPITDNKWSDRIWNYRWLKKIEKAFNEFVRNNNGHREQSGSVIYMVFTINCKGFFSRACPYTIKYKNVFIIDLANQDMCQETLERNIM